MSLGGAHYVIGCDYGVSGYFCKIDIDDFSVEFSPLPSQWRSYLRKDKETGEKKKERYRIVERTKLQDLIRTLATPDVLFFAIEQQQSYPHRSEKKYGTASVGRHLLGYGVLIGLMMGTHVPIEEIKPQTWKAKLGLTARGEKLTRHAKKKRAWQLACNLFPELVASQLTPQSYNIDKAESLLISLYGLNFLAPKYGIKIDADHLADEPAFL